MFPSSLTVTTRVVPVLPEAIMGTVAGMHCATGVNTLPDRVSINFTLSGNLPVSERVLYQRYRN